ncbi:hypothetical protein AV521_38575 [Streptomyces sp. IMTB 2501]|uniref:hypothetical protein n=1 Tax=Streptomyces sp. IMTB 2501 TaxID=1776340 RepID=UPI00096FFD1B|nr:hypothetical protein [Streptomyces sp. IMTB 2501]OLZ63479.1 hypothetical protein AV521_38575 [Streptomyces sp. IMTB 2501]
MTVIGGRTPVDVTFKRTSTTPGGPEGNERLTAATGAVLLVLFAVEGITILFLGQLLTLHFFVGLLLTGPVCLKIGSTGYRFYRYYTGSSAYRRKGPPAPLLRVLGPLVVATSIAVLGTGVALALLGPGTGSVPVLLLHKASFVCWVAVMAVHVLAYLWRLPRLVGADLRRRPARHGIAAPWRAGRWSLLAVALGGGLVVALAGLHLVSNWSR